MLYFMEDILFYMLCFCFGKEFLVYVKSVDDDVYEMWKWFDEKYGDLVKVMDVIINEIRCVRFICEGENKWFMELVEIIEDGYCDFKRFGLEVEIIIMSLVSIIERKFLLDVCKEWVKLLSFDDSIVDKINKFLSLFKFLFM